METHLQNFENKALPEEQNHSDENKNSFNISNIQHHATDDVKFPEKYNESLEPNSNFINALKSCFANITVEPICILFSISKQIFTMVDQNLFMEKICTVNLGYNDSVCQGLIERNVNAYTENQENAVQKYTSAMIAYKMGITAVVPLILLMLLGAWSDRFSRKKPCIILPLIGEVIGNIGMIITIFFFKLLSVEWSVLLSCIPSAFGGNFYLFYMALYNYLAAIVERKSTTIRIGALTVSIRVSMSFGFALSGLIYNTVGFYGAYSFSLVLYIIALILAINIEEVPEAKMHQLSFLQHCKQIVHYKNITNTLFVVYRKRPNNHRVKIIVLIITHSLVSAITMAEYTVTYMFARKMFLWNEIDYTLFLTASFFIQFAGNSLGLIIFEKYFGWDDGLFGLASAVGKFFGALIHASARSGTIFYLGNFAEALNSQGMVSVRSAVVKFVEPHEIAKISGVLSMVEALSYFIFTCCYSKIYTLTVDSHPNAYLYFTDALCIPTIFLFYWLHLQMKNMGNGKNGNK